MKKLFKYSFGLIGGILLFYFLSALVLSFVPTNPESVHCDQRREMYVSSNGIHLDFVLPAKFIHPEMLESLKIPHSAEYVSFGWGDRGFYLQTPTWSDLKFSVAFNAVFLRSESAMHVDYHFERRSGWVELTLCSEQQSIIVDYINESFKFGRDESFVRIDHPGYTETDSFYEAKGSYNLIITCNEWVNVGLKRAHVKTSVWSPFEFGVLHHLE